MLYRLVQQQAETFFAETEAATGVDLPQIVKDEFDTFLACGILAQRFLSAPRPADAGRPWGVSKVAKPHSLERLRCEDCGHDKLVAFSCKRCGLAKPPHRMPNIAGSTAVTKTGTGTATLAVANTYTGATAVQNGTLALGDAAALGTSTVTVDAGATLDLAGLNVTGATLLLNGGTIANASAYAGSVGFAAAITNFGAADLTSLASNVAVRVAAGQTLDFTAPGAAETFRGAP